MRLLTAIGLPLEREPKTRPPEGGSRVFSHLAVLGAYIVVDVE